MINEQTYHVLVRFFRDEDFPGWTAHVLHLDAVTHGESLQEAIDMALEAAGELIVDDLNAGLDPSERAAPQEEWVAAFGSVQGAAQAIPLPVIVQRQDEFSSIVVGLPVIVGLTECDDDTQHHARISGDHGPGATFHAVRVA